MHGHLLDLQFSATHILFEHFFWLPHSLAYLSTSLAASSRYILRVPSSSDLYLLKRPLAQSRVTFSSPSMYTFFLRQSLHSLVFNYYISF